MVCGVAREDIDQVLESYGPLSGRALTYLSCHEGPWIKARQGFAPGERGHKAIEMATLQEYYSALDADDEAKSFDAIDWEALGLA